MRSSIRHQWIAWQAVLLLAVVLFLGGAFYLRVRRGVYEQADAELLGAAQSLALSWSALPAADSLAVPDSLRHRMGRGPKETPYFAIWNQQGTLQAASADSPAEHVLAAMPEKKGPHPYAAQDHGPNREVILHSGPWRVLVGRNLQKERDQLQRLLVWLAAVGGGILACGWAGAWLLARPLEQMTATAEAISADTLSARLVVPPGRDETARLAEVINQMLVRLQQAFQRQQQFTADASHELRTPVAVVLAQAESALAGPLAAEEYRESLQACRQAALRMKTLLESLLTLARGDAGWLPDRSEVVDLRQVIDNALRLVAPAAQRQQVALAAELTSAATWGDAVRLEQVVVNLLGNAIAYNRPGGQARIALRPGIDVVELVVEDNGIGIAAEHLPHLGERFYRVDSARTTSGAASGLGLGLSICRDILRAHQGTLEVASQPGQGTTVVVRLPAVAPVIACPDEPPGAAPPQLPAPPDDTTLSAAAPAPSS